MEFHRDMGVSINEGSPNGWFIWKPIKMDDLGAQVPILQETSILLSQIRVFYRDLHNIITKIRIYGIRWDNQWENHRN